MAEHKTAASKVMYFIGWIVSALPILMLGIGGIVMLAKPDAMADGLKRVDFPANRAQVLAILEVSCSLLYAIPRTSVLGAILLTGYLGGAVACHVRMGGGPDWLPAVIAGVLVWLGLFLRDARIRAILPLR